MTEQNGFEVTWRNFTYVDMKQCAEYFWKTCAKHKDKEIAKLREKLAAQQAIISRIREIYTRGDDLDEPCIEEVRLSGMEELAAIKAAEYQRGYNRCVEFHNNCVGQSGSDTDFISQAREEGKQAGRAELEKELMEQDPVDYEKLAPLGWQSIECPFCGSTGAQAFPQQKPLSDAEIGDLWAGCVKQYGHIAGLYKHQIARAIEAAHGITGEKK
jgi:hypothetical protein